MTDKEQIEEMNRIMQEAYNDHCENVTCVKCPYFDMQHGKNEGTSTFYCQNYLEANALYNAGYCKVSNNEVVISKDELKRKEINYKIGLGKSQSWLKVLKTKIEELQNENFKLQSKIETACKEKAKEILLLLLSDEYICYFDVAVVKEIAEKYNIQI